MSERAAGHGIRCGSILLVGSRDPHLALSLQQRGLSVVIIDERPEMVLVHRERGHIATRIAYDTLRDLEYPVDHVLLGDGMRELPSARIAQVIDDAWRLVAPGGRLVVASPLPNPYDRPETIAELCPGQSAIPQADRTEHPWFSARRAPTTTCTILWDGSLSPAIDKELGEQNIVLVRNLFRTLPPTIALRCTAKTSAIPETLTPTMIAHPPAIVVRHRWPLARPHQLAQRVVGLLPYRFTTLPPDWSTEHLNDLDELWTPHGHLAGFAGVRALPVLAAACAGEATWEAASAEIASHLRRLAVDLGWYEDIAV